MLTEDIDKSKVAGVGLSNQRETSLAWDRVSAEPIGNAIVWQCARVASICERVEKLGEAENIRKKTGMNLSPYFPASKIAWILENEAGAKEKAQKGEICHGTIDSWLVFKLTGGKAYKTDYSNASRTQLFNIFELKWDEEICKLFGIDVKNMAEVCNSDSKFGETDFEGVLPVPVPIHGVLGDSRGSLFGQGCLKSGMTKATYGTGSSIMMNIGEKPVLSTHGVVTSLAWSMGAAAAIVGMTRTTGKAEIVRAGVECIAYQITDIVKAMSEDAGVKVRELRVDGGPTKNGYLMQFQSDIADAVVQVPDSEELSGIGPAYAAGLQLGVWDESIFGKLKRVKYEPEMEKEVRTRKYAGWKSAVGTVLTK